LGKKIGQASSTQGEAWTWFLKQHTHSRPISDSLTIATNADLILESTQCLLKKIKS